MNAIACVVKLSDTIKQYFKLSINTTVLLKYVTANICY